MAKKQRFEKLPESGSPAGAPPSRLADYFWANLLFFAFLLALALLVRYSCEQPGDDPAVKAVLDETFGFFLKLMGGGFLLVTLFDAGYEFFAAQAEEEETPAASPSQP